MGWENFDLQSGADDSRLAGIPDKHQDFPSANGGLFGLENLDENLRIRFQNFDVRPLLKVFDHKLRAIHRDDPHNIAGISGC